MWRSHRDPQLAPHGSAGPSCKEMLPFMSVGRRGGGSQYSELVPNLSLFQQTGHKHLFGVLSREAWSVGVGG